MWLTFETADQEVCVWGGGADTQAVTLSVEIKFYPWEGNTWEPFMFGIPKVGGTTSLWGDVKIQRSVREKGVKREG